MPVLGGGAEDDEPQIGGVLGDDEIGGGGGVVGRGDAVGGCGGGGHHGTIDAGAVVLQGYEAIAPASFVGIDGTIACGAGDALKADGDLGASRGYGEADDVEAVVLGAAGGIDL